MSDCRMPEAPRVQPRSTAPRAPLVVAALVALCLTLCCGIGGGARREAGEAAELLPLDPGAATAGPQRLSGTLTGQAPPLTGPVSGQPCVCLQVQEVTSRGSGKNRSTHRSTVRRGCTAFALQGEGHALQAAPDAPWDVLAPTHSRKEGRTTLEERCLRDGERVELVGEVNHGVTLLRPGGTGWVSPQPVDGPLHHQRLERVALRTAAWLSAVGLCWALVGLLRARGAVALGLLLVGAPGLLWVGHGLAERADELERRQLRAAWYGAQLEGAGLREAQRAALAEAVDWRARDQARLFAQLVRAGLEIPRIPRPLGAPRDRLPPALVHRPSAWGPLPGLLAVLPVAGLWATGRLWLRSRRWPPRSGATVELIGRVQTTGDLLQAPLTEEPCVLWSRRGELQERERASGAKRRSPPRWWTVDRQTKALPLRLRLPDAREVELKLRPGWRLDVQRERVLAQGPEVERLFSLPRPAGLVLPGHGTPATAKGRVTVQSLPAGASVLVRGREDQGALLVDEITEAPPATAAHLRDQPRARWLAWMTAALGLGVCAVCVGRGWIGAEEQIGAGLALLLLGLCGTAGAHLVARSAEGPST